MKTAVMVIMAIVVTLTSAPAFAAMQGSIDLEIISDRGDRFPLIPNREYRSGPTRTVKSYLEARRGENYTLRIRNRLPERIGVVVAVDGRNIITGKSSNLNSGEMMYVIGPHSEASLEGWRTGAAHVNRFYFTGDYDSYSVRTFGDASAMGVIAIAVFREMQRPLALQPEPRASGKAAAPSAPRSRTSEAARDEAGTGFGSEQYSPVVRVEFEPEVHAWERVLVKYEWREELCRKGILKCRPAARNRLWDSDEYAPYPPEVHSR